MSFKPTDISNCCLWLDTTKITGYSNNQAISTMADLSNACKSISMSSTYITNGINNKPSLSFNGSNQYIYLGNYLGTSLIDYTIFIIHKSYSGGGAWQRLVSCHSAEDYLYSGLYLDSGWSASGYNNDFTTKLKTQEGKLYLDNFYIGKNVGNSCYYYGLISEVILYKRQLDKYETNLIGAYLQNKYGTTITYNSYKFMLQDGNNLDIVNDTDDVIVKDITPITYTNIYNNGMYYPPNVNSTIVNKLNNTKYKIALYKK